MRSEFENSLGDVEGLSNSRITWSELTKQYEAHDDDHVNLAEWLNGKFSGWKHRQPTIDFLSAQLGLAKDRGRALEQELINSHNYGDELQKRVDSYSRIGLGLIQDLREARLDPQSIKEATDQQFYGSLERLEQALKGGGE